MKFKHVVLFGVVASIMSYLNSAMETESGPDKQETILNELKDLIDNKLDEVDIDKKLEELKEEVPEHFEKATMVAKDVTDTLIDELNSIVASLGDITTSAIDTFTNDEVCEDSEDTTLNTLEAVQEMTQEVEETIEEEIEPTQEELDELLERYREPKETLEDDDFIDLENVLSELEGTVNKEEIQDSEEACEETFENEEVEETLDEVEETEEVLDETQEELEDSLEDEKERLINELEDLISHLDTDGIVIDETSDEFSEDDYLSQIKEAISNSLFFNDEVVETETSKEPTQEVTNEINQDEIDEIFSEILKQEGLVNDEPVVEEKDEAEEYLDELVDELNSSMEEATIEEDIDEEVTPEVNEEEVVENLQEEYEEELDVYAQINELYPYLSRGFVRAVYDLKEAIANEYPVNHRIIILHRLAFSNLEDLRQFAEIVLNHDYRVNVDENKMIVDIFKEVINTDGKILTNIFEIANQAKLLEGSYEGYRIELI